MINADARKASESGAVLPVSLPDDADAFIAVNLKGAANLCVCSLKALEHSGGYVLRAFYEHPSKICARRIYKINEV